jgi:Tol biopolymer transport system component
VAAGEIFSANHDGTGLVRLTQPGDLFSDNEPAWSPDNRLIVFVRRSTTPGATSPNQLIVMNADGAGQTQIPLNVSTTSRFIGTPDWSADGSTIVFAMSFSGSNGRQIYTVGPTGANFKQLIPNGNPESFGPAWSLDGRKIAFLRKVLNFGANPNALFVMNADGSGTVQIASVANGNPPAFSPDGQKVAYVRQQSTSTNGLIVLQA